MNQEEINTLFIALIKDIDVMIEKDFYKEKQIIKEIKEKVQDWFNDFKISKTLNNITLENIKFIDEEITELIDKYINTRLGVYFLTFLLIYDIMLKVLGVVICLFLIY